MNPLEVGIEAPFDSGFFGRIGAECLSEWEFIYGRDFPVEGAGNVPGITRPWFDGSKRGAPGISSSSPVKSITLALIFYKSRVQSWKEIMTYGCRVIGTVATEQESRRGPKGDVEVP